MPKLKIYRDSSKKKLLFLHRRFFQKMLDGLRNFYEDGVKN